MQETLAKASSEAQRAARARAYAMPLSQFHVGNPELFRTDTLWPYFERLRQEEPVHRCWHLVTWFRHEDAGACEGCPAAQVFRFPRVVVRSSPPAAPGAPAVRWRRPQELC